MTQSRYSLPRKKILRGKRAFEYIFEHGSSFREGVLKFVFCKPFPDELAQHPVSAGFSAPKKLLRKAVQRNRIKRCMREAYRLNQQLVTQPAGDVHVAFLVIYQRPQLLSFHRIEKDMVNGLKKLQAKLDEHP
ncbi:MAG: ribonuclease P protein component [Bacteroidia bacterium]